MTCQMAATEGWHLVHIDLKTAFLQGEALLEMLFVNYLQKQVARRTWVPV